MNYPEDLKQKMIKRMLPPNNEPISKIAREEGIAEQTLRNWQKAARENGIAAPGKDTTADQCTTEDKFLIVVETAKMNESELAEYARQKGLFVEQIKAWKDACLQANGGVAKEAAELNKKLSQSERQRIVDICNSSDYSSMPPCEIVPALADEGTRRPHMLDARFDAYFLY